jgi:hypothetical protein
VQFIGRRRKVVEIVDRRQSRRRRLFTERLQREYHSVEQLLLLFIALALPRSIPLCIVHARAVAIKHKQIVNHERAKAKLDSSVIYFFLSLGSLELPNNRLDRSESPDNVVAFELAEREKKKKAWTKTKKTKENKSMNRDTTARQAHVGGLRLHQRAKMCCYYFFCLYCCAGDKEDKDYVAFSDSTSPDDALENSRYRQQRQELAEKYGRSLDSHCVTDAEVQAGTAVPENLGRGYSDTGVRAGISPYTAPEIAAQGDESDVAAAAAVGGADSLPSQLARARGY